MCLDLNATGEKKIRAWFPIFVVQFLCINKTDGWLIVRYIAYQRKKKNNRIKTFRACIQIASLIPLPNTRAHIWIKRQRPAAPVHPACPPPSPSSASFKLHVNKLITVFASPSWMASSQFVHGAAWHADLPCTLTLIVQLICNASSNYTGTNCLINMN